VEIIAIRTDIEDVGTSLCESFPFRLVQRQPCGRYQFLGKPPGKNPWAGPDKLAWIDASDQRVRKIKELWAPDFSLEDVFEDVEVRLTRAGLLTTKTARELAARVPHVFVPQIPEHLLTCSDPESEAEVSEDSEGSGQGQSAESAEPLRKQATRKKQS
jgi:hypothetical protein